MNTGNQDPATGHQDPEQVGVGTEGAGQTPVTVAGSTAPAGTVDPMNWKNALTSDNKGFLESKNYEDGPDGLNSLVQSYANAEKLIGHDKVPIPKNEEDVEGWSRFSKAMGIPDKAENYGLSEAKLPESMKGMTINKDKFAEIVHAHKLTPAQAKGLWEAYTSAGIEAYTKAQKELNDQLVNTVNQLKSEWGDAYDVNIELGQAVINKFSADQDAIDFITSTLAKDPRGVKFLAKIGDQFAENKIPEFSMKRFSLAPEQAKDEIDKMVNDLEGPYMNTSGKFTGKEHQAAIDRVNFLRAQINKAKR